MGSYLVPAAKDITQVIQVEATRSPLFVWRQVPEGIVVSHPTLTDLELAALYAAYIETPNWRMPLAPALLAHASHLRDYRDAVRAGTAVTNAQTTHVIADIIDYLRLTEDRL